MILLANGTEWNRAVLNVVFHSLLALEALPTEIVLPDSVSSWGRLPFQNCRLPFFLSLVGDHPCLVVVVVVTILPSAP